MFKLRKEHLQAFEAQVIGSFTARAVGHCKAVWAAECGELGDAGVVEAVRGAIARGAACGLTGELDMIRFVDLYFILAQDFETNPLAMWTRPILADKTLAPAAKIDRLYHRMEEEFVLIEKRRERKS